MESCLPHPRRTIQTNGHVLRSNKLPRHFSDDDEHHLPNQSCTRLVISIYGRHCCSHKTRRTGNGTTTYLPSPAIRSPHAEQTGTERPIPQTREMQLQTKRNRLPRYYRRKQQTTNGPKEVKRCSRLAKA